MEVKQRKLTHRGARQKGKRGEYYVRDELIKIGIRAKRIPMSGALSWLKGDVGEFNVEQKHIHEVKNQEALCLADWWRQSSVQSLDGEIPTLHFSGNRRPVTTVMRAVDFDNMVAAYEEKRPELVINLINVPSRFNFWTLQAKTKTLGRDVYFWELAGRKIGDITYPSEQLVIFPFALYLLLRKYEAILTGPA